jgi:MFS family permease
MQSTIGDQLARVALSILVFRRTGSATATALTYAATYLPAILGGVVLAGIGDRLPRRFVMIGCDLVRAGLFAAMAIPSLPTLSLIALVVIATFLAPAFSASEVSYLAATLEHELFRAGTGLRIISNQVSQVLGFAVGGALVAALGPRESLLLDAMTYLLSALIIGLLLRHQPRARMKPAIQRPGDDEDATDATTALRWLWGNLRVRALLMLSVLAGLFIVPEGLAVPFGSAAGASTFETGLLLASIPLGGAIGAAMLVRLVRRPHRLVVAGWMAIGCGLPLVVTALVPHWPVALVCWAVSGLLAAYQVEVTTSVVNLIPDALRARMIGVASAMLLGAQGLGLIVFGWVARYMTPGHAIALAGLLGSALALLVVVGPWQSSRMHDVVARKSVADRSESGHRLPL